MTGFLHDLTLDNISSDHDHESGNHHFPWLDVRHQLVVSPRVMKDERLVSLVKPKKVMIPTLVVVVTNVL